jgi:hypothetical protein
VQERGGWEERRWRERRWGDRRWGERRWGGGIRRGRGVVVFVGGEEGWYSSRKGGRGGGIRRGKGGRRERGRGGRGGGTVLGPCVARDVPRRVVPRPAGSAAGRAPGRSMHGQRASRLIVARRAVLAGGRCTVSALRGWAWHGWPCSWAAAHITAGRGAAAHRRPPPRLPKTATLGRWRPSRNPRGFAEDRHSPGVAVFDAARGGSWRSSTPDLGGLRAVCHPRRATARRLCGWPCSWSVDARSAGFAADRGTAGRAPGRSMHGQPASRLTVARRAVLLVGRCTVSVLRG